MKLKTKARITCKCMMKGRASRERQQLFETSKVFTACVDVYEYHLSDGRASKPLHVQTLGGEIATQPRYIPSPAGCTEGDGTAMNKRAALPEHT